MSKSKNWGTPQHYSLPIINELKLLVEPAVDKHERLGVRYYPSSVALVSSIHDNLGSIMATACDVFVTPNDLFLLDESHGVLGGGARKELPRGHGAFFEAKCRIGRVIKGLWPMLPFFVTGEGHAYFIPALTMPLAARVKFATLSELDKFKVALKTKRVFVNGEEFMGYGGSGKQIPGAGFWSTLFEFDVHRACSDSEIFAADTTKFSPGAQVGFWLERCVHRDGGHTRLMDHLDLDELCAGGVDRLVESLKKLGWNYPSDLYALKYLGAAGNHRE